MTNPTADAAKLLPCPICGKAPVIKHHYDGGDIWQVVCSAHAPFYAVGGEDRTKPEAIAAWNTHSQRTPSEGEPDYVYEAKRMIDRLTNRDWCDAHVEIATLAKRMYHIGLTARPQPAPPEGEPDLLTALRIADEQAGSGSV